LVVQPKIILGINRNKKALAYIRKNQFTMPESNVFDAIVVGSGISGGWAAKELTEKGLKVIMLERGRNIEHVKDYTNATKDPWEFPHRGGRTQQMIKDYPVLKRDYPLNETNLDFWAKDSECPYTEVKRFDWFRGYHVGGRSLMWGRQSYRWSELDFESQSLCRAERIVSTATSAGWVVLLVVTSVRNHQHFLLLWRQVI